MIGVCCVELSSLIAMAYDSAMHLLSMDRTRYSTIAGSASERQGHLRAYDGRSCCPSWREENGYDRRDLSEGPPNSDQHGREKGGGVDA